MNQNLEVALGLRGAKFPSYPTLRVDNGDDKQGTNATGEFVEKDKDENQNIIRKKFGTKIEAVVLMTRAKCNSKFKENVEGWYTHEFNPFERDELITIVRGKTSTKMLYSQLKNQFSVDNGDGTRTNNYVYKTILYLGLPENKIVKLVLTGLSQSNWFDFQSAINGSLLEKSIVFEIVRNEEKDCFEAKMSTSEQKTDVNENLERAKTLLEMQTPAISAPQHEAIEAAPGETPPPESFEEVPTIDVEEDPGEIKEEDIPW